MVMHSRCSLSAKVDACRDQLTDRAPSLRRRSDTRDSLALRGPVASWAGSTEVLHGSRRKIVWKGHSVLTWTGKRRDARAGFVLRHKSCTSCLLEQLSGLIARARNLIRQHAKSPSGQPETLEMGLMQSLMCPSRDLISQTVSAHIGASRSRIGRQLLSTNAN